MVPPPPTRPRSPAQHAHARGRLHAAPRPRPPRSRRGHSGSPGPGGPDQRAARHPPRDQPPPPATHPTPHHRAGNNNIGADPHPPATPTNPVGAPRAPERHARRGALITVAALIGWMINLGLSATADIIHLPTLGITSLILAPLLVVALVLNATRSPRRPGP